MRLISLKFKANSLTGCWIRRSVVWFSWCFFFSFSFLNIYFYILVEPILAKCTTGLFGFLSDTEYYYEIVTFAIFYSGPAAAAQARPSRVNRINRTGIALHAVPSVNEHCNSNAEHSIKDGWRIPQLEANNIETVGWKSDNIMKFQRHEEILKIKKNFKEWAVRCKQNWSVFHFFDEAPQKTLSTFLIFSGLQCELDMNYSIYDWQYWRNQSCLPTTAIFQELWIGSWEVLWLVTLYGITMMWELSSAWLIALNLLASRYTFQILSVFIKKF